MSTFYIMLFRYISPDSLKLLSTTMSQIKIDTRTVKLILRVHTSFDFSSLRNLISFKDFRFQYLFCTFIRREIPVMNSPAKKAKKSKIFSQHYNFDLYSFCLFLFVHEICIFFKVWAFVQIHVKSNPIHKKSGISV